MDRILLVCLGNICRSPMAEAVGRQLAGDAGLAAHFHFDSAGTAAMRHGRRPDPRAIAVLQHKGYAVAPRAARSVVEQDFARFDLILAMDRDNLARMKRNCAAEHAHKLRLFMSFAPGFSDAEVPDPYFGDSRGFEHVLDLCEAGLHGLIKTRSLPLSLQAP